MKKLFTRKRFWFAALITLLAIFTVRWVRVQYDMDDF